MKKHDTTASSSVGDLILDKFGEIYGYHRKYALRRLKLNTRDFEIAGR